MGSRAHSLELVAAFNAGYRSAIALVEMECGRPAMQRLALQELAVLLRRQSNQQQRHWQQRRG